MEGLVLIVVILVALIVAGLVYGHWQGSRAVMHYRAEVDMPIAAATDVVQRSLKGHNRFAKVDTWDSMVRRRISKEIKFGPLSGSEVRAYVVVSLEPAGAETTKVDLETTWEGDTYFFGVMPVTLHPITAVRRAGRRTLTNLGLDRKAVVETT